LVSYGFDGSGRVLTVYDGPATGSSYYASNVLYWGHGAIAQMTEGALAETTSIDARMRTTGEAIATSGNSAVLNLGYVYFANSNLQNHTVQLRGQNLLTQTFGYDAVNRLMSASEAGGSSEWSQNFAYDQFGNRSLLASSTFIPYPGITPQAAPPSGWVLGQNLAAPVFNAGTNQIVAASYDAGGNQRSNLATASGDVGVYDGENRLSQATVLGSVTQYVADGDGRRVMKVVCSSGTTPCTPSVTGAVATSYVYDAQGNSTGRLRTRGRSMCTRTRWGARGWRRTVRGIRRGVTTTRRSGRSCRRATADGAPATGV
jgi:hypothetical protein